ncbi:MAG: sulfur carrier protein ThiS [Actinomycetota bacterium]|nr:sulfur carrier protein ThiS [Actinomycetota bacterium]
MNIELNGSPAQVPDGIVLNQLIEDVAGATRGSAASVDGIVVPRSEWQTCVVRAGQSIELITAVQGG